MGGNRGGWYSWDWIDNQGEPSADRIVSEWQHLEQADQLYRVPKGPTGSRTAHSAGEPPRGRNHPRLLTGPLGVLVFEPVHFIMQTRQFHNLRTRLGDGHGCDRLKLDATVPFGVPTQTGVSSEIV